MIRCVRNLDRGGWQVDHLRVGEARYHRRATDDERNQGDQTLWELHRERQVHAASWPCPTRLPTCVTPELVSPRTKCLEHPS